MFKSLSSLTALNKYYFKYKWYLIGGFLFIAISNYFRVLQPQYIRRAMDMSLDMLPVYDMVKGSESAPLLRDYIMSNLVWFGVIIIIQALIMGVFMFFMRQTIIVMSRLVEYDMRKELYGHLQKLDRVYYTRHSTGDNMARLTEDVSHVRSYLGPAILYNMNLVTLFVLVIYAMFQVNTRLAIYTLLPLPFLSYSIFKVSEIINQRTKVIQTQLSKLSTLSLEIISGIRLVKSYAQEDRMQDLYKTETTDYSHKYLKRARVDAIFFPLMIIVIGISTVVNLWVGGRQVAEGVVTPGNIAEFFIYIILLTWPITSLGWTASLIQQAAVSQTRINDILHTEPSFVHGNKPIPEHTSNLIFDRVDFVYPDTCIHALKQFTAKIKIGSKIAIIGETGSGKSTIAYLLMQFFRPQTGEILLDQVNINDFDLNDWRAQIGYVPQDSFLFSDTIANNISFGARSKVNSQRLKEFASFAAIHEEIMQMPDNYQTLVGERGVTLSGGQKQRISIARALISQPKILLLDNALSAVDADTDARISNYLNSVGRDITLINITQRINTNMQYDEIIVLGQGHIIESGTHEELMMQSGYYQYLYTKQNLNLSENFQ